MGLTPFEMQKQVTQQKIADQLEELNKNLRSLAISAEKIANPPTIVRDDKGMIKELDPTTGY